MYLSGNILAGNILADLLQRYTREQCNAREWQCSCMRVETLASTGT